MELDLSDTDIEYLTSKLINNSTDLISIKLPKTLKYIENHTFKNCINLKQVDLSECENLEHIGQYAFDNCVNLKELDLSKCKNLKRICDYCFFNCDEFKKLILPTHKFKIDDYMCVNSGLLVNNLFVQYYNKLLENKNENI